MRDGQPLVVDDDGTEQGDVEVERSRAVLDVGGCRRIGLAAGGRLDLLERLEQGEWL